MTTVIFAPSKPKYAAINHYISDETEGCSTNAHSRGLPEGSTGLLSTWSLGIQLVHCQCTREYG
jgi:hypothetical protein